MKTIDMQFEKKYYCKMIIGNNILADLKNNLIPLLPAREVILITNPLVKRLYGERLVYSLSGEDIIVKVIEVPDGEKNKNIHVAENIYDRLLELKTNRSTTLIALGGGVIGDLGGFVAATFMRGIPLIHIPTTLLAQIDSSIGGKVAVDHLRAKNIIGSFYQPIAIFTDSTVLQSLPDMHLKNGLVEAIKIAIIGSPSFFHWLEENIAGLLQKERGALDILVNQAIQLKRDIILQDPWEKKHRHYLNLGHSIGHALEAIDSYEMLTHGEAVAAGLLLEARLAFHRNICSKEEIIKIENIIKRLELPMKMDLRQINMEKLWNIIQLDKKNKNGVTRFVLPEKIGKVHLVQPIFKEDVVHVFNAICDGKEVLW